MEYINFTKMHGIGNDYVYIECMKRCPSNLASLSREMSDRHKGVGGDGIILIMPSGIADFKMRIFNADGSEARMCGNGARCVGKYVFDNQLTYNHHVTLETISGVKHLYLKPDENGMIESVTVDMGKPSFDCRSIPVNCDSDTFIDKPVVLPDGTAVNLSAVSMGNPHAVVIVSSLDDIDISRLGAGIERLPLFPDRANVEFVKVNARDEIEMRVWERGSGETMACGTGACAAVAVTSALGLTGRDVNVDLRGGRLHVSLDETSGNVMMTGPAETVFTGTYYRHS